jgi:hypothetical protein
VAAARPHEPALVGLLDVLTITAGCVAFALSRRRLPRPVLLGAAILTLLLATRAARYEPWFVLAAVPLAALLFVAAVLAVRTSHVPDAELEQDVPTHALVAVEQVLACHPGAAVLADQYSADALLWRDPQLAGRVAFDGRLELYPEAALRRWAGFIDGSAVTAADRGGHDVLLASTLNRRLSGELQDLSVWIVLAVNERGIASVRASSSSARC